MTTNIINIDMKSEKINQREFIEMLKQLALATRAMRKNAERIDLLLEEAHRIPLAA